MPGEPSTDAWLEQQLERALERIDALSREVARAQDALATREQQVDALRQSLEILDGRTRRHETAIDAVPELRRALADVAERLIGETALRPDAAANRSEEHTSELQSH